MTAVRLHYSTRSKNMHPMGCEAVYIATCITHTHLSFNDSSIGKCQQSDFNVITIINY